MTIATCRFYSPPGPMLATTPGAQLGADYPYNEPHPQHSICTNPLITGGQDCVGCAFEADQSGCPGYDPETWTPIRRTQVGEAIFTIETCRVALGVVDRRVVVADPATRVLHVVSTRHHGNAHAMTEELFELEVAARARADEIDPVTLEAVPVVRRSYVAAVLAS